MMLSVHRPALNITARLFQQSGLISYGNGRLRVTDLVWKGLLANATPLSKSSFNNCFPSGLRDAFGAHRPCVL